MFIMDSQDQVLRRKTLRLVRVLWQHRGVEKSTWEREDTMHATYPFLFRDDGTWNRLAKSSYYVGFRRIPRQSKFHIFRGTGCRVP